MSNMTKEDLCTLIAWCNNVIMKGSYSGEALIEAADCMNTLTDLFNDLSDKEVQEEVEEHA